MSSTRVLTISDRPDLVLDGSEDPFVEVVGTIMLGGTLVVADGGTQLLHVYRRSGELQRIVGGRGQGPGEFVNLRWIQGVGDEGFAAYDGDPRRLSRFTADGELRGSVRVEDAEGYAFPRAVGVFGDGSLLVTALPRDAGLGRPNGVSRALWALLRYGADGEYRDSLTAYRGTESYAEPWRGGQIGGPLFFGRKSAVAVGEDRFYVVENDDARIAVFDGSGTPSGALRPPRPPAHRPVTEEDIAALRRAGIEAGGTEEGAAVFDRMPFPATFPPYGWHGVHDLRTLRVDRDGDVWVLHAATERDTELTWTVFERDGSVKARVRSPEILDILASTDELVVVLHRDDLDVETVQIRRLLE